MNNTIIIKIESGVVAEVYSPDPLEVIIVDYDLIEGGETFEHRIKKSVLVMHPDQRVTPDHIGAAVKDLVLACGRPADARDVVLLDREAAA